MTSSNRWRHRELDRQALRAMGEPGDIYRPARWSCDANGNTPTSQRKWSMSDTRRPQQPKVLLAELAIRTSSSGTEYLSGYLGKARIIGFKAKELDRFGNSVWQLFAQAPEPKPDAREPAPSRPGDLADTMPF